MRRPLIVFAAALAFAGCREGVAPYVPPVVEQGERDLIQITFGSGQDRDPVWMNDDDVLLYHTDQYGPLPSARGALLRINGAGGVALPVLESIQRTGGRLLTTPAVSPDGSSIAYIEMIGVDNVIPCAPVNAAQNPCPLTQPILDTGALRVRRLDATQPSAADPSVGITFAGTDPGLRMASGNLFTMQAYPFQQMYRDDAAVVMRPSWAPDNQRIVFSDGLNLRMWRVGDAESAIIPGTFDGTSPAWSPLGDRIAFAVLERVDSALVTCTACSRAPDKFETHRRWVYQTRPRVVTIAPDGSNPVVVGEGDEPAWTPDAQSIYMRSGNEIVRVPAAGGTPVAVPQASFGRAPAVSPDGRWLAFSRRKPILEVDWDIWVVSLTQ